jgi:hypothetical protein
VRNCTSIVHLKGKTAKGKNAPYVAPFYVPYQLDRRQGVKAIYISAARTTTAGLEAALPYRLSIRRV